MYTYTYLTSLLNSVSAKVLKIISHCNSISLMSLSDVMEICYDNWSLFHLSGPNICMRNKDYNYDTFYHMNMWRNYNVLSSLINMTSKEIEKLFYKSCNISAC